MANAILNSGYEFETGKLLFNYYKNVASNETQEIPLYSQGKYSLSFFSIDAINRIFCVPDLITSSESVSVYDSLDADVVQSYLEYSLASLVYYCMKEGATSEQASRMSAMDNSSKNAGQYWNEALNALWRLFKIYPYQKQLNKALEQENSKLIAEEQQI